MTRTRPTLALCMDGCGLRPVSGLLMQDDPKLHPGQCDLCLGDACYCDACMFEGRQLLRSQLLALLSSGGPA